MESAIRVSLSLSRNQIFSPISGDKQCLSKGPCTNQCIIRAVVAATAPGKGGGVLERPTVEKSTPGRESEFDVRKSRKTAPPYRVMLHNDEHNRREYVVQVLMKVIPGMTVDNAVNIMQEAHYNGLSVVIICAQADAEEHCMQLRGLALFDTCYDLSSRNSVQIPTVMFHFPGDKTLSLPADSYLIPVDSDGTFCLAFAPTGSSLSIIGNVQQQGIRVGFDLRNSVIGFSPNAC